MRTLAVLVKTFRETRRDRLMVLLTLVFAPFFVLVYHVAFGTTAGGTYHVAVLDTDRAVARASGGTVDAGAGVLAALTAPTPDGAVSPLRVRTVTGVGEGQRLLRDRDANVLLVLPPDLSRRTADGGRGRIEVHGDLTDPAYLVAAVLANSRVEAYLQGVTGRSGPLEAVEVPLGGSATRTAFDQSVAGLLVFSAILLVFLTAMTVARESEQGATRRLRLSPMPAHSYLIGTSAVLLLIATVSAGLTFATAWAIGFRSRGPLVVALVVIVATAASVIGVGMIVGAACRTVATAFVVANFPLGLLMFLSGVMFPVPRPVLFTLAGHGFGPLDLLPTAHAVLALDKVLTLGSGLADVAFELTAVVVLSALYFAAGAAVLRRRVSR